MDENQVLYLEFGAAENGLRIDQALARRLPQFSRTTLQAWLKAGHITVAGVVAGARQPVRAGDQVRIDPPPAPATTVAAQDIPLVVVFEDDSVLVINKPAGLTVHPGAGCHDGTMQNALLFHAPDLDRLPRSGIVHRLDRDTSGLLVIARTEVARLALIGQLKSREMGREYWALVTGRPPARGFVEAPIGRDPRVRTRMAVVANGRPARTDYEVMERLGDLSLLHVRLQSGRTHQIRVHMSRQGYPLVGDAVYGDVRTRRLFRRQALHAFRLTFRHPQHQTPLSFTAPLPTDLTALLAQLRATL
ncbi:MAG: RluA family pseudouridine synthase [Acidiferrobacter sp.]